MVWHTERWSSCHAHIHQGYNEQRHQSRQIFVMHLLQEADRRGSERQLVVKVCQQKSADSHYAMLACFGMQFLMSSANVLRNVDNEFIILVKHLMDLNKFTALGQIWA